MHPTNWMPLKGLLTYRTIQFSMSSGCCHPKTRFALVCLADPGSCPVSHALSPIRPGSIQRTKNPSADLIILNSASQTFVNSRLLYQCRAGCQRLSFLFLPVLRTCNFRKLTIFAAIVKIFFCLFSPSQNHCFTKNAGGRLA